MTQLSASQAGNASQVPRPTLRVADESTHRRLETWLGQAQRWVGCDLLLFPANSGQQTENQLKSST